MGVKSAGIDAAKYIGQGVPYAALVTGVAYLWILVLAKLTIIPPLVLLVIVLALLTVGWGYLNSWLMRRLWFPVRRGWKVHLIQGVVLSIAFVLVQFLPMYVMISPLFALSLGEQAAIVLLVGLFYAVTDGYLGRSIGAHWKVRGVQAAAQVGKMPVAPVPEVKPDNPNGVCCPTCNGTNLVVAPDHSAYCIDCRKGILRDTAGRFSA